MDLRTIVAAIALLCAAFAGCVSDAPSGGPGGPAETDDGNVTDVDDTPPGGGPGVDTLTFDAPANASVRWANGSYGPTDGGIQVCLPERCEELRNPQPVAVGDLVPHGVPVVVDASLTTQTNGSFAWLELSAPGADVYRYSVRQQTSLVNLDGEASRTELSVLLGAFGDESIEVVVKPSSSGGAAQTDYTLRIEVQAWTDQVPSGVPVAVEVDDPGTIAAEPAPEEVLFWDPNDLFLGPLASNGTDGSDETDGSIRLPAGPPGEYVLLPLGDDPVQVSGDRPDTPLRLLRRDVEVGETHELSPPSDEVSWDFEVPFRANLVTTILTGASGAPTYGEYVRSDVNGSLGSPTGAVWEWETGGLGGGNYEIGSIVVDPTADGFAPGTWTATWSMDNGGPMEARHVIYGYER